MKCKYDRGQNTTKQARIARCVERGNFRHKSKQSNTQDKKRTM